MIIYLGEIGSGSFVLSFQGDSCHSTTLTLARASWHYGLKSHKLIQMHNHPGKILRQDSRKMIIDTKFIY